MKIGIGLSMPAIGGCGAGGAGRFNHAGIAINLVGQGGRAHADGPTLTTIFGAARAAIGVSFWARRAGQDWSANFPSVLGSSTDWNLWTDGFAVYARTNVMRFWANNVASERQISVPDDAWHHYAFTWDGGPGSYASWLDGAAVGTTSGTPATGTLNVSGTQNFAIGIVGNANQPTSSSWWGGYLDEVALYGDALALADAQFLYGNGIPPNLAAAGAPDNLLAWYRLGDDLADDPTFTTGSLRDVSGSGHHLTPTLNASGTGEIAIAGGA